MKKRTREEALLCKHSVCPRFGMVSCISERHLPAWEQALATAKEHLSQRRLPVLQRTVIEQPIAGFSRVITSLKGAKHGGESENRTQASGSDGSSV